MRFLIILLSIVLFGCNTTAKPKYKMALKDNLIAYWNFEQDPALGYSIWDQSGNSNNLTAYGNPILVDGKLGKALQFNGVDQWLSTASNAGFSHDGGEFTAFLWFKPLMLAHQKTIATTTEWGVGTTLSAGNYYVSIAVEDETVVITDVPLEVGKWYLIALGWYGIENAAARGQFVWGTVNLSDRVRELQTGLTPAPGPFSIAGTAASGWANAIIDDVAIFRRFVSAQEVRAIYNHGEGLAFEEWDAVAECKAIPCCD